MEESAGGFIQGSTDCLLRPRLENDAEVEAQLEEANDKDSEEEST